MQRAAFLLILFNIQIAILAQSTVSESEMASVDTLVNMGDLEEAQKLLEGFLNENPQEPALLIKYGSVLIQMDDDSGVEYLRSALKIVPNDLICLKELGMFYLMKAVRANLRYEREEGLEQKEVFKKVRDTHLDNIVIHFERIITLQPKDILILRALQNVYGLKGDKEELNRITTVINEINKNN